MIKNNKNSKVKVTELNEPNMKLMAQALYDLINKNNNLKG